ncbi:hypothetical protein B0O80DRAFT_472684 [Mortierella sp. GBAus27b]|nr:hypothetical protein B0O80DRAFT_472684 [Mortierella sp. GBAus27b]
MGMQVLFDKTYRTRRLRNNQTDNALTHGTTPLIDGPVPAPTTTIPTSPTTTPTPPTPIRFPKLRELKLAMIDLAPDHQMEQIIVQCPMLHTLVLRLKEYRFSMRDFCNFLEEGTWPYLDSLEITGQYNVISTQEHTLLLESTRRPFKRLDLYLGSVEQGPFDLLREGGHFDTLTKIDLSIPPLARSHLKSMVNGVDVAASKRIREVLESCPSLEHFSATAISGRDIIGSKPWVCHRLQKFEVLICMELTKQYTTRVVYTKDEKIRCHQVFERLSQLRHLKVLNMSNPYLERFLAVTPVTLPLELRMGLGRLSTLRDLESIGYQGSQRMRVVDVEWMLKHWSKLRTISGGRPSTKYSKTFGNRNVECYLLVTALKARKVEVPVEWGACEKDVKEYMTKNRLEIVYDTDNDSEEVNDSEMDEIGRAIAVGMRL